MLFIAALFVAFVSAEFVPLVEERLVGASYTEEHNRVRNLFSVTRLDDKTVGLDSVLQAQLFTDVYGEVYIGTSKYNNYNTFTGPQPVLHFDGENSEWVEASVQPTSSADDAQYAINYFTTKDGKTWSYNALFAVQNNTARHTNIIRGNGTSAIHEFDSATGSFVETAAFTFLTNFSSARSTYFETSDGREFLWTYSFGSAAPTTAARTPAVDSRTTPSKCTLIEYKSGWSIPSTETSTFIGCPASPRAPLSFANVNGNWVYMFPSHSGAVLTLNYRPSLTPQFEVTADVLDNFSVGTGVESIHHWVDAEFDMITAVTTSGVRTFRLHWATHFVEELGSVPAPSGGLPYDISFFAAGERHCFVVGSSAYNGLQTITPTTVYDYTTSIWCWDQSRDVWDLATRFPSEYTWFNQVFADADDEHVFYMVTLNRAHLTSVAVKTYKIELRDDDEVHIEHHEGPSTSVADQTKEEGHENRHVVIAIVSLVSFLVLLVLVLVFLNVSGGGGSGGDNYTSFNN